MPDHVLVYFRITRKITNTWHAPGTISYMLQTNQKERKVRCVLFKYKKNLIEGNTEPHMFRVALGATPLISVFFFLELV